MISEGVLEKEWQIFVPVWQMFGFFVKLHHARFVLNFTLNVGWKILKTGIHIKQGFNCDLVSTNEF